MYASVASYIMQGLAADASQVDGLSRPFPWRWDMCAAIYANFFTDHYIPRSALAIGGLCAFIVPSNTGQFHRPSRKERRMPLALSFLLIGFFIWVAENIATYFGAWQYPYQKRQWAIVGPTKISSWMLLVIISFIIVAALKEIFPKRQEVFSESDELSPVSTAEAETKDSALA